MRITQDQKGSHVATTPQRTAPLYRNGAWEETPDVVSQIWDEDMNQDFDVVLQRSGFEVSPWSQLGDTELAQPLALLIYARRGDEEPEFLVEVNTSSGATRFLYAHQVHDVMDLATRWAPAIQAGAISDALRQLVESGPEEVDKSDLVRVLEQIKRA